MTAAGGAVTVGLDGAGLGGGSGGEEGGVAGDCADGRGDAGWSLRRNSTTATLIAQMSTAARPAGRTTPARSHERGGDSCGAVSFGVAEVTGARRVLPLSSLPSLADAPSSR